MPDEPKLKLTIEVNDEQIIERGLTLEVKPTAIRHWEIYQASFPTLQYPRSDHVTVHAAVQRKLRFQPTTTLITRLTKNQQTA